MQDYTITGEQLQAFRQRLVWEEKSPATIEKYLRDAAAFTAWLDGRAASKAAAGAWKAALLEAKLAPATINVKLAAVNRFLVFLGWPAFRVKPLRIQRAAVPGRQPGADEAGVPPPAGDRPHPGPGTAGAAAGNHLAAPESGCPRCAMSPWRPCTGEGPKSP